MLTDIQYSLRSASSVWQFILVTAARVKKSRAHRDPLTTFINSSVAQTPRPF